LIEAVLFDLGGVLEKVAAAPRVDAWTRGRIPASEFWARWLSADSVQRFETGRLPAREFSVLAVSELGLEISPDEFLHDFRTWLAGPYDGALELLADLRERGMAVASFSNSNEVHWPIMERHQDTDTAFHANFPSHRLGLCKPHPEAFVELLHRWDRPASSVLFLDDNEVNCLGARRAGIEAERVDGPAGARAALRARGILPAT
jgi:HAD superfamily hydrolase (TIGR01509 family)